MMKKMFSLLLLMLVYSAVPSVWAQSATDYNDESEGIFVSLNDTSIVGLSEADEWTIHFTNKDTLDRQYNFPIGLVFSRADHADSTAITLCEIDSMLCQTPRTIVHEGVYEITEQHFAYIVGSDTLTTIVFNDAMEQELALPRKGQKIFCNIMRDFLPVGFIGQVEAITHDAAAHRITVVCSPARIEDIYEQYFNITSPSDTLSPTEPVYLRTLGANQDNAGEGSEDDPDKKKYSITVGSELKVDCEGERKFTLLGTEVTMKTQGNITVTPHSTQTVYHGLSYTKFTLDFSITPSATFSASVDGEEKEHIPLFAFDVPTPIPGLLVEGSAGLFFNVNGSLAFDMTNELNTHFKLGFEEKYDAKAKDNKTYLIYKNDKEGYTGRNQGSASSKFDMTLSGSTSLGASFGVGMTLAKVITATFSADAGIGMKSEHKLNMVELGGNSEKDEFLYGESDLAKNRYDILTGFSPLDVYLTFGLDATISVLNGWASASLSDFGLDPSMNIPIRSYAWAPSVKLEGSKLNSKGYHTHITWERPALYDNKLGVGVKDISKYGEPLNYYPSPGNMKKSLGTLRGGTFFCDKKKEFDFDINFENTEGKHYNGKTFIICPYSWSMWCGTVAPQAPDTIYVPYHIHLDKLEYDFDGIIIHGTVDPKIVPDPTQKIFARFASDNAGMNGKTLPIDKKYIQKDGTFVVHTKFIPYEGKHQLNLVAYSTTEKRESKSKPLDVKTFVAWTPMTAAASDITMNSARLNADLRDGLLQQNEINGFKKITAGFEYGLAPIFSMDRKRVEITTSVPQIAGVNNYYIDLKDLQPGAKYKAVAYTKFEAGYGSEPVIYYSPRVIEFTTESYIQDMQVSGLYDFNYALSVSILKKYFTPQQAKITFEVSEQEDFSRIYESIDVDFANWEDFDDSYQITVNLKKKYSYKTTYYWRVRLTLEQQEIKSRTEKFVTGDPWNSKMISAKAEGNKAHFVGEISVPLLEILQKNENMTSIAFEYSTSDHFKNSKKVTPTIGNDITLKATAENLDYNTKYYVRLVVENTEGQYPSNIINFKTPDPYGVTTNEAVVEDATVILNATLHADTRALFQGEQTKACYAAFDVAKTVEELDVEGKYTRIDSEVLDKQTGKYSATIILDPSTTYYCRAVVYADYQSHPSKVITSFKTADFDPGLIPVLQKKLAAKKKAMKLTKIHKTTLTKSGL